MAQNKNLLSNNTKLMAEWNYEKNGDLNPFELTAFSNKKVWWKCEFGHEWEASIASRTNGNGCPYCSGSKVLKGFNDLETLHPKLAKEWHPTKNNKHPSEVSAGTHMKAWWICYRGHEWEASIASRTRGNGCPYCAGRKAWRGFNDLGSLYPNLAKEWHPIKNNGLTPFEVTPGSDKKVWWMCKEGHEWEASISSRVRGNGCPYCSGKVAISGYNDLKTVNPKLASEWHPTRNKKSPSEYLPKSNKKVWWKCNQCGYEWEAAIYSRTAGRNCPCCAGQVVQAGVNDLATTHPELSLEWHPAKNGELNPTNVTKGTDKKVWWKCAECGYEWEAFIYSRTAGNGCPFCAGKIIITGVNDFATLYPELAKEWHPTKNKIHPSKVHSGSNDKFWWLCGVCGHEWKISVNSRAGTKKSGCPKCSSQFKTSFAEQAIYYYLRRLFPDAKNRELIDNNEIDIYLPSLNVGIEYDGAWYHKSEIVKQREERKNENLKKLGIRLFRVKEVKKSDIGVLFDDPNIYYSADNGTEYLNDVIYTLIDILGINASMTVNVEHDRYSILEQYKMDRRENSLAKLYPALASEWHPTKNGNLTPEMFTPGSNERVWWLCEKGHEWKTKICHRCSGSGCPECYRDKIKK